MDITHHTDYSVEGSHIIDELYWEFDSKKLKVDTN